MTHTLCCCFKIWSEDYLDRAAPVVFVSCPPHPFLTCVLLAPPPPCVVAWSSLQQTIQFLITLVHDVRSPLKFLFVTSTKTKRLFWMVMSSSENTLENLMQWEKHANNLTSEHHNWETAHLLEISYGWRNMCPLGPSGHIKPLYLTGVGFQGLIDSHYKDLFCHQLAGQQTYSCWSH